MRAMTPMDRAAQAARSSDCARRQVGAVLKTAGGSMLAASNGALRGLPACPERDHSTEECVAIHAEAAVLGALAASSVSTEGAAMYVTCAPCAVCARLIIASKISMVIYRDDYRTSEGLRLLKLAGIKVVRAPL